MKLLTVARDLKRRKARERNALFVVEGVRASEELLRSPLRVRGALISPYLAVTERGRQLSEAVRRAVPDVVEVSDRELESAAHTDSPQGIVILVAKPERSLGDIQVHDGMRLLVLDAVQDPGNTGTMLRTAAAFGLDACIALPGTVDLWSAKVVRSAMGSQFNHLSFHSTLDEVVQFLIRNQIEVWGTEAAAGPPPRGELPRRLALAVGNEGGGHSTELRQHLSRLVGVPLEPGVESLNVAVAAGILLHQLRA